MGVEGWAEGEAFEVEVVEVAFPEEGFFDELDIFGQWGQGGSIGDISGLFDIELIDT